MSDEHARGEGEPYVLVVDDWPQTQEIVQKYLDANLSTKANVKAYDDLWKLKKVLPDLANEGRPIFGVLDLYNPEYPQHLKKILKRARRGRLPVGGQWEVSPNAAAVLGTMGREQWKNIVLDSIQVYIAHYHDKFKLQPIMFTNMLKFFEQEAAQDKTAKTQLEEMQTAIDRLGLPAAQLVHKYTPPRQAIESGDLARLTQVLDSLMTGSAR